MPDPPDNATANRQQPSPVAAPRRAARPAHRDRSAPRIALNLTAMIDVTFLLLVYFLTATEFRRGEELYRMDLPPRAAAAPRDPFDLDERPLRILVATTGFGRHAYSLRLEGPYPHPGSFTDLHEFLRRRRISAASPGGLFDPDHPIIIQPTTTTTWQHAMQAFDAAARAQYNNITFDRPG